MIVLFPAKSGSYGEMKISLYSIKIVGFIGVFLFLIS